VRPAPAAQIACGNTSKNASREAGRIVCTVLLADSGLAAIRRRQKTSRRDRAGEVGGSANYGAELRPKPLAKAACNYWCAVVYSMTCQAGARV